MNRFGARCSSSLRLNEDEEEDRENDIAGSNTNNRSKCVSRWLLNDPLARRESPIQLDRDEGELACNCCGMHSEKEHAETRREWEAYRLEMLPRIRFFKCVVEKYLVEKVNTQQTVSRFRRWKRFSQIESSLGSYQALVLRHRAYYLHKALLRTCWQHLAQGFLKWQQFMRQSAVVLLGLSLGYGRRLKRLALGKWYHRVLLTERLEEETAASVWIRRQYQRTQVIQRKLRRSDRQLLVSYWVNWRVIIRKWKCILSDRRLRFQNRWVFVQWTHFVVHRKQDREIRRQPVRELVDELTQNSVFQAQVKQAWAPEAQKLQIAVHVIERIAYAYQYQVAKQSCFRIWRAAATAAVVAVSLGCKIPIRAAQPQTQSRKVRLPERISTLYRSEARRGRAPGEKREKHRPHWR